MPNYKMTIQYDGTRYSGWQKQGNTDNTIQGRIEKVLTRLAQSPIEINGSGRTDAGVHALGQVASFRGKFCSSQSQHLTPSEIQDYLNEYLPQDIRVLTLEEAGPRFHARLNATSKHYRYVIDMGPVSRVFDRKYVTRRPCTTRSSYDLQAMKEAAALLIGEHDFKSFCENKHMKKPTVRRIDQIQITQSDGLLTIDYYGNGFLYHMVRILTGTLLEVGEGSRSSQDMNRILDALSRPEAGFTAPPQGLILVEVEY